MSTSQSSDEKERENMLIAFMIGAKLQERGLLHFKKKTPQVHKERTKC